MKKLATILVSTAGLMLSQAQCFAQNPSSDCSTATSCRIDGVSKFLIKRANENAVFILQQNMKKNTTFQCLFPNTAKLIGSNNLDLFLQSGQDVWKRSVDTDLDLIEKRLLVKAIDPKALKTALLSMNKRYSQVLKKIGILYNGRPYTLKEIANNRSSMPQELQEKADTVSGPYAAASEAIFKKVIPELDRFVTASSTECPTISAADEQTVLDFKVAVSSLSAQVVRLREPDITWKIGSSTTSATDKETFVGAVDISKFEEIAAGLTRYHEKIQNINVTSTETVARMFEVVRLIEESTHSGTPLVSKDEYDRFSRYALSLALLSNAKTADQAASVMEQLALPPVSFAAKRNASTGTMMITAYFAGAGGVEFASPSKGYGGLTVPVGLEFSQGFAWDDHPTLGAIFDGSYSLMLSPVDFAQPVNKNIVNASGNPAKLKDILAPGVYLSHGFKDWPIVIGAGYNYGPTVTRSLGSNRGRAFVFAGLDLPLFRLF